MVDRRSRLAAMLLSALSTHLCAATIGFEGQANGTAVGGTVSGAVFTNARIVTAGLSLNEIEFPPRSGQNVVLDIGGPITITFALPTLSFSGFFTYRAPLTLVGLDGGGNPVGLTTSAFANNQAVSGVPGSAPNELLSLAFAGGLATIIITGDPSGTSLALDDVAFDIPANDVPEPGNAMLLIATCSLFLIYRHARR